MKVQVGIESYSGQDDVPEDNVDLYLGLENVLGPVKFNLLMAEALDTKVRELRSQEGKSNDDRGRLGMILSAFQPKPDRLGMITYQRSTKYILRVLSFGGVLPEMFPINIEVPADLQDMVAGLQTVE